jgi:impB/mucB/samB family C-terminal domain
VPGLAEYVAAFGLCDQVFENRLRFLVDFAHAFAGPPLEPALDDEVAPVAVFVGIIADDHAIFFEVQHLDPRDAGVARENRCRAQRLFGVVDPELIGGLVEYEFDLTLVLILLDHRSLVDDLQFPPDVPQAFPQRREIPVDRGWSHFPESPELEALDDGFIDAVEREIPHRIKLEQLRVVAFVELDRPRFSGVLSIDPDVELRPKLLKGWNLRLLLLDDPDLLLDQLQPLRTLDLPGLEQHFSSYGARLHGLARGIDESEVILDRPTKSISVEDTFEQDVPLSETGPMIRRLAEKLWSASRKESIARTVVLKLKTSEFRILTRSHTPSTPPLSCEELIDTALALRERVGFEPT